jgi:hypothetical protein
MTGHCHRCGAELEGNLFSRGERCPGCGADTRCCRNCVFDDPACGTQCLETQAEPVREREDANFCDFFRPRLGGKPAPSRARADEPKAKASFDALFRKPPREDPP